MNRHEKFLARLAEIAGEYEKKEQPEQRVQGRLRWENWEKLRQEAVLFAKQEIRRRHWRGGRNGVLPGGYDAEGVANQVIREMLEGNGRLALGLTREKVVAELKRLTQQRVRVLHRLKEAGATREEWQGIDGEGRPVNLLKDVADAGESTFEAVVRREEQARQQRVIEEFDRFLEREPKLRQIFRCLDAGMTESKEIGRRLGIDARAVVIGRKSLDRRLGEFRRVKAKEQQSCGLRVEKPEGAQLSTRHIR